MAAIDFHYTIGSTVEFRFSAKPPPRVLDILKGNGFRWAPRAGAWWRNKVTGAADLVTAIDKILDPRPDGACWSCKSAAGYFRNRGAAAPVLCDDCNTEGGA